MHRLWLLAPAFSFVLLGAHLYRAGLWPLVFACGGLVALLAVRRAWAARLMQFALAAGALEWLWTAFGLVQARMALGQPWIRLLAILVGVAVVTAASALVFAQRRLRERYALDG
jgi:hypothetical protein